MKERCLDVIKWGLILAIAGVVFYAICPKYEIAASGFGKFNKITGGLSMIEEVEKGLKK